MRDWNSLIPQDFRKGASTNHVDAIMEGGGDKKCLKILPHVLWMRPKLHKCLVQKSIFQCTPLLMGRS